MLMKTYIKDYCKLVRFVRPYLGTLIGAVFCMGVSTLFEGVSLGAIGPLTDRVFTRKDIVIPGRLPEFLQNTIASLNAIEPAIFFKYMLLGLPLLFFAKGIFFFLQEYLMNKIGQGAVKDIRNSLYKKFQELSMDFYTQRRTGELMSRVTNDVSIVMNSISYALKDLIFESMKTVFFAFMALWLGFKIAWQLPLIIFIIFPAIMLPVAKIGKRIKKYTLEVQKKMADLNSIMAETIQGAYIVKAFCREGYEIERFRDINQNYYKFSLKTVKRVATLSPLTEFIGVLGAMLILWLVAPQLLEERLSFGGFAMFLIFLMSMIRPMKKLSNVHAINQRALAASERIYSILEEEPTVKECPQAISLPGFAQGVCFKDVWFRYNEKDDYVLKGINLEVRKGQTIALVGHSGVGKSTLVGLLPRFYDPQKGQVLIDGIDIAEFKLASLRSAISVVSQDTVLFNTSIRDNIAYGKLEASEAEIVEAAKKAHAYEFIMNMPEQFDTVVGDRGFRLSGGEKQRLAIARAILKNSPLLILDEATSSLDARSEQLIKEALEVLMQGRTAFVIAHRLSTIQKADLIVVLDSGRIVETGTHSELLEKNALYKNLHSLQFNA